MQNALALAAERVGPTGTWVARPFSACGTQMNPLITGGEKGSCLVFVMLHNNSIVLSYFSVASPIFTCRCGYLSGPKSELVPVNNWRVGLCCAVLLKS